MTMEYTDSLSKLIPNCLLLGSIFLLILDSILCIRKHIFLWFSKLSINQLKLYLHAYPELTLLFKEPSLALNAGAYDLVF